MISNSNPNDQKVLSVFQNNLKEYGRGTFWFSTNSNASRNVLGDVFGEEELVGRRVLAEPVFGRRTRVHEGLRDDGQARVDRRRLVDVEHEVRILDEVDPEAQRQAETIQSKPLLKKPIQSTAAYK